MSVASDAARKGFKGLDWWEVLGVAMLGGMGKGLCSASSEVLAGEKRSIDFASGLNVSERGPLLSGLTGDEGKSWSEGGLYSTPRV